jgi:hypothetical protein
MRVGALTSFRDEILFEASVNRGPSKDNTLHVLALAKLRLAEAGFQGRKPGIFTMAVSDGVLGWVGLNTAHREGGIIEVGPIIGVRHQALEALVSECLGAASSDFEPPSVSVNIGYLMKEKRYRAWSFEESTANGGIVDEMCDAIEEFGLKFMRSHSELSAVFASLADPALGVPHQNSYRVPAALFLLSRESEAREAINSLLAGLGARQDLAATSVREFSRRLCFAMKCEC